jgi:hypothetical protein
MHAKYQRAPSCLVAIRPKLERSFRPEPRNFPIVHYSIPTRFILKSQFVNANEDPAKPEV